MNNKGNHNTSVIVFIMLFLLIAVVSSIIYLQIKKNNDYKDEELGYTIEFKIYDESDEPITANYRIKLDSLLLQEGIYSAGSIEQFTKSQNNTNYTIEAFSPNHYPSKMICNNLIEFCELKLITIGNVSLNFPKFDDDTLIGAFQIVNKGIYLQPLLCFGWDETFLKLESDLPLNKNFTIPTHLKSRVDYCSLFDDNLTDKKIMFINYKKRLDSQGSLKIYFTDRCNEAYEIGCGIDYFMTLNV